MIFDVAFHTLPALPIWFEVIIDWHDHSAEKHEKEATKFFREMAKEYGEFPNVIFEIYNEPIAQDWSQTIKPYHERIVKVIRKYSSNLIVLGTRTWSQDVDEAAQDPVQGENLAYTIHFYANTHMQDSWQTCCNSHSDLSNESASSNEHCFGRNLAFCLFVQELRDKVTKAVQSVAVFATEWGTCDADGDGTLNFQEAKIWFPGFLSCRLAFDGFWRFML